MIKRMPFGDADEWGTSIYTKRLVKHGLCIWAVELVMWISLINIWTGTKTHTHTKWEREREIECEENRNRELDFENWV